MFVARLICTCLLIALPVHLRGESVTTDAPGLKPRFVLRVPSVQRLLREAQRSHAHRFVDAVHRIVIEAAQSSAEGLDASDAAALITTISEWPDVELRFATFAPDLEGRARWVIQSNWSAADLQARLRALFDLDAASSVFEGVSLDDRPVGGYVVRVSGERVAYVGADENGLGFIASHADLTPPVDSFNKPGANESTEHPPLLAARLNLSKTETDSGATFLSSFRAVTAVDYQAAVDKGGNWDEQVRVHWPTISGMGAKALFERVGQTFFVPDAALGAFVANTPMAAGFLDTFAGLGPQVIMDAPGEMEVVGEAMLGPIASQVGSDVCLTLLPGTGFFPSPDVVIQVRTRRPERLIAAIRRDVERINTLFVERDQPEPWREVVVRNRAVFWSEPSGQPRGLMLPLVMRPVLFTTTETDAKERKRNFLVIGLTSTDPVELVQRWLNLPRTKNFRHLPSVRKLNGQVWLEWRNVYSWISPYLNVGLSSAGIDALFPSVSSVASDLTEAVVSVKIKYSGLTASHAGPLPAGVLVVPSLLATSLVADEFGASDLARERLATQRLKLLYHHAKLFHNDIGRWPAEIGELDGYVDFAGHPELLQLHLSTRKQWSRWFSGMAEAAAEDDKKDDDEDDTGEEDEPAIRSDVYVINWSHGAWSLGFKPDTFEHLDRLYIDENGDIHRLVKPQQAQTDKAKPERDKTKTGKEDTTGDQSAAGDKE